MEQLMFGTKDDFRAWLLANGASNTGVWLIFGKENGPATVKPSEALEEALCFGWIDGQMKSIDEQSYIKYFSPRRNNSKWSEKNKTLAENLEKQGRMTEYGRARIEEAKKNGSWNADKPALISEEQIHSLAEKLAGVEPAYSNFLAMSPSVKRTYTGLFLDAKSEQTRSNRLNKIIDRLNQNLKPM